MSIPQRNTSKVGTGSNIFEIIKEYVKAHKVGSAIGFTTIVSLALSIFISMSIIASVETSYELKTSKVIEDTLNKDKQITDIQRTEIIRNLGFNTSTQRNIVDYTTRTYSITNEDKAKLILERPSECAEVTKLLKSGQSVRVLKPYLENQKEEGPRSGPAVFDYIELIPQGDRGYIQRFGGDFSSFI